MAAEELSTDSINGDFQIASTQAAPHGPQSNSTSLPGWCYVQPPHPPSTTTTTTLQHQPSPTRRPAVWALGRKPPPPHLPSCGPTATAWFLTHCPLAQTWASTKSAPKAPQKLQSVGRRPCPFISALPNSQPPPRPHTALCALTSGLIQPALDHIIRSRVSSASHVRLDTHRPSCVPVPTDQGQR